MDRERSDVRTRLQYPVMFPDYLRVVPVLDVDGPARWLLCAAMLAVVTALNLLGVDAVADVSYLFHW